MLAGVKIGVGVGVNRSKDQGDALLPETLAYKARVDEDGGISDDNLLLIDEDIRKFKEIGVWDKIEQYISQSGGMILDENAPVSVAKIYDVMGNCDLSNAIKINQPVLQSGDVFFGEEQWLSGTYVANIAQPFQRILGLKSCDYEGTDTRALLYDGLTVATHAFLYKINEGVDQVSIVANSGLQAKSATGVFEAPATYLATFDSTNPELYKNTTALTLTGDIDTNAVDGLMLGNYCNPSAILSSMSKISYFIQLKSGSSNLLSSTQRAALINYLNTRYGLK